MQRGEQNRNKYHQHGDHIRLGVAPVFWLLFGIGHDRLGCLGERARV